MEETDTKLMDVGLDLCLCARVYNDNLSSLNGCLLTGFDQAVDYTW